MMDETRSGDDWLERNRALLTAWVEHLRERLHALAGRADGHLIAGGESEEPGSDGEAPAEVAVALVEALGLTRFARGVLMLLAAAEIDAEVHRLCGLCLGAPAGARPTFGLALSLLPGSNWTDLHPEAPLRRLGLVELEPGAGLLEAGLRIDEGVLHHLFGFDYRDVALRPLLRPPPPAEAVAPSHAAAMTRLAARWREGLRSGRAPVLAIDGPDPDDRLRFAAAVAAAIGWGCWVMAVDRLPMETAARERLGARWARLAALDRRALVLDAESVASEGPAIEAVRWWVGVAQGPAVVCSRRPLALGGVETLRFALPRPTRAEQRALWVEAAAVDEALVDRLVNACDMTAGRIALAVEAARGEAAETGEGFGEVLWRVCREQNRGDLDELARRVEAKTTLADLVLPEEQTRQLHQICAWLKARVTLFDRWGLDGGGNRGLGAAVLFAGASGTGKTTAAEAVADAIGLDLYHIDLSGVMSKYIGETERNLARIFDAAEASGAVLLFDEADALFGRRTAVRDSHDRYANVETSYLLQRVEAFRGLAVLTSNMKQNLDPAFLRRLRFVVDFPAPDAGVRRAIWERMLPPTVPTSGIDLDRLAQLSVTGGVIRNIVQNAAALAAEAGGAVTMAYLLDATRSECRKLERPLTPAEIKGWLA